MRDVEIRDLVLRLSGVSRDDAAAIGAAIAKRLTETVPEWRETDVPELALVRVRLPAGATPDDIVRRVADAVAGALR